MRLLACVFFLAFAATAQSDCWGVPVEAAGPVACNCELTGICTCNPYDCKCAACESWEVRDGVHYLMRHGVQVGGWNGKVYRDYDARTDMWGEAKADGKHPRPPKTPNYGVDVSRISKNESCAVNGKKCSKKEAVDAVSQLPDDSKKIRCTIIGKEADRKKVRADLALLPEAKTLVIQDYDADHWAVKSFGFVTTGNPTIYFQAPDGKVLHRQDDYSGPEELQEAIRKANEGYDAKIDIDLRRNSPQQSALPTWVWYVGGAVLVLLILKKKKV